LRNIVNDAVKKISLEFDYSYLVIAKPTMLNNEYAIIKETLFQDLERIRK
jgi:ribonuclease P protein component